MKLSIENDLVIIQGKKIRLVFEPVISKDEYLRGAFKVAVYWRAGTQDKWTRMNSDARAVFPPVCLGMQPEFFVTQSRVNEGQREAQHSFTVRFEPGAHDMIATVVSAMTLTSLVIFGAIEEFEKAVNRPATEREIEGLRLLFVRSAFQQITDSAGVARLADKHGKLYFPEDSDLFKSLANQLMAHAYNFAAEQRTQVFQHFYALLIDDDKPIQLPGKTREPVMTRVVDGVRVEGQVIRIELRQAATEKKETWGALQIAAWRKVETGPDTSAWEPLNNPADTIAPVWSFICTDEALLIHDTQGKGRPDYDEMFTLLLEPGMGAALAAAGLHLILTSMASTETLKAYSQFVKRPPTERETEAIRVLLAKYFVDQVDPDEDMSDLADSEGKPYFPQDEPLIQALVEGNVLPQIIKYANEMARTLLPKMKIYQPQGYSAPPSGRTLQ